MWVRDWLVGHWQKSMAKTFHTQAPSTKAIELKAIVESGLLAKGGKVRGVAIAGKDQKFVWADAEIDGGTLLVFRDGIKNPVAVRYAWDIGPENNMYNGDGLPASPFRTDDWNGVTYGLQ